MNRAQMDLDKAIILAGARLGKIVDGLSVNLGVHNICVVGGAVRDTVLGYLTGHNCDFKDIDIMVSAPLTNIDKYPGLLSVNKNTFGGTKLRTRDFGEIDIWHYDDNTRHSVMRYFDFNCNSLYYDYVTRQLLVSNQFQNFVKSNILDFGNSWYGRIESIIIRAIKFYILFNKNFGMNIHFSPRIISHIVDSKKLSDEYFNFELMRLVKKDAELRHDILNMYNSLRGNRQI